MKHIGILTLCVVAIAIAENGVLAEETNLSGHYLANPLNADHPQCPVLDISPAQILLQTCGLAFNIPYRVVSQSGNKVMIRADWGEGYQGIELTIDGDVLHIRDNPPASARGPFARGSLIEGNWRRGR